MFTKVSKSSLLLLLSFATLVASTAGARPAKKSSARSSSASSAAVTAQFQEAGRSIPSALLNLGYQNFGQLDLSRFISEIESYRVTTGSAEKVGGENNDGRVTARWTSADKTILVNTSMWSRYANMRETLALHEYLSIMGFQDSEYRISQRMWTLALPETQSTLSDGEKQSLASQITMYTSRQYAGGVVGVGGGGESTTLYVRAKRIQNGLQKMRQSSDSSARQDGLDDVSAGLNSQLTASYLDTMRPESKRASAARVKEMFAHPLCMTQSTTCPVKNPNAPSCTCGSETDGIIIYPHD